MKYLMFALLPQGNSLLLFRLVPLKLMLKPHLSVGLMNIMIVISVWGSSWMYWLRRETLGIIKNNMLKQENSQKGKGQIKLSACQIFPVLQEVLFSQTTSDGSDVWQIGLHPSELLGLVLKHSHTHKHAQLLHPAAGKDKTQWSLFSARVAKIVQNIHYVQSKCCEAMSHASETLHRFRDGSN